MHQPSSYVLPGMLAFFILCCLWLDRKYDMEVMPGKMDPKAQGRAAGGHPFMGPAVAPGKWKQVNTTRPIVRGDIVLFFSPLKAGTMMVSRVVALEGEQVSIEAEELQVDSAPLVDDHGIGTLSGDVAAYKVPTESYFLLNDRRASVAGSLEDSRYLGPIHRSLILGVVSPEGVE